MKLIDKISNVFKKTFSRGYNAAKKTRLLNWGTLFAPINRAVKEGIGPVRERARELYKNNSYAKGIRNLDRSNIIGHNGFTLQNKALLENGELDEEVNTTIETAFKEWCQPEYCTMRGNLSFTRVLWLWQEQLRRDGEVLARIIPGPAVNKFGFSLELLESDNLDHELNKLVIPGSENIILMGIEYDPWFCPVNYYIKKRKRGNYYNEMWTKEYEPVPASQIIYGFDFSHPKQARGISDLSTIIADLQSMDSFETASLKNAEWSAKLLGFFVKKRMDGEEWTGENDELEDIQTHGIDDAEALELPFGMEYQNFQRQYPNDMHTPFIQSLGKKISTGGGHDYASLFNDRTQENYSSMRSGKLTAQDLYMVNQKLLIEIACVPVVKAWLKQALLMNAIPGVDYADIDRVCKPHFQPRRWPWVDPLKDVNAAKMAIQYGLSTQTEELAKLGIDFNDWVKTRKRELEILKSNGLKISETGEIELISDDNADDNTDDNADSGGKKNIIKFKVG